ncbi:MAG: hypothetical protein WC107_04285 [Patescibacteria group bacterium]
MPVVGILSPEVNADPRIRPGTAVTILVIHCSHRPEKLDLVGVLANHRLNQNLVEGRQA